MHPLPEAFHHQMRTGAHLHQQDQPEQALVAFEAALQLAPGNTEAASACATLLMHLQRPQAAHSVLYAVYVDLMLTADGATNWAIVCEANGQNDKAKTAYTQALALDPNHLRALNNAALLAASAEDWDTAIQHLTRCVSLAPDEPAWAVNLCDVLTGAHQHGKALTCVQDAWQRFAPRADLAIRRAVLLAFNAQFEAALTAMQALPSDAKQLLQDYLLQAQSLGGQAVGKVTHSLPSVRELFVVQACAAMQDCHWHMQERLVQVMRQLLAEFAADQAHHDWRDTQFYALMLPLTEAEQTQFRTATARHYPVANLPPYRAPAPAADGRIRVGLLTQSLHDPRYRNALQAQLALHDTTRFAIHLYCPTPQPQAHLTQDMQAHAASITEIAHLDSADTARRMRLDQLDLCMDGAFYTPWCRAEVPYIRVAPIQIRQQMWQRVSLGHPNEYIVGDHFTHPDALGRDSYGAVVRLPHTCWLASNNDSASNTPLTRQDLGWPASALVLCAYLGTVAIDPDTFAMWMEILRSLPHAVLNLPAYGPSAQANLHREATAHGVAAQRIIFSTRAGRAEQLGRMQLADLFVDSLRFNANNGLADALRMGVPALSCAGHNMASRLGGSIIRAAGLPDYVLDSPQALVERAVNLGQDSSALQALRTQLATAQASAPLFQPAQRVREWESAWTTMVQRHRAGLPPASFDVVSP